MDSEDILTYSSNHSLFSRNGSISNIETLPPESDKRLFPLIQFIDVQGNTPLHRAVNNPNCTVDSVRVFLHTSFLNDKNFLWHIPLHCIIMSNCQKLDVIEVMLKKGADIHARDRNGSTALHKAVQNPKCTSTLIDLLIKHDAHLSDKQYGTETPLMLAVRNRNHNLEIIEKLIYKGCIDICMRHNENHSTLRILCSDLLLMNVFLQYSFYVGPTPRRVPHSDDDYAGDEDIVDFSCPHSVCGYGSIQGSIGRRTDLATALLLFAVKYPSYNMDVVRELLQKGADIYAVDCRNYCALEYAVKNPACSLVLVQELLKYDRPEMQWDFADHGHVSFLHMAASNRKCPADVMKVLLKRDGCKNLNQENLRHRTPLDCAADLTQDTDCNLEVVETLLMRGATMFKDRCRDAEVLWKNIQVLGGPNANRVVLECTKLLVKHALTKKDAVVAYSYVTKMFARFRWRDNFGYFAELTSYFNRCFTEMMVFFKTMFGPVNFFIDTVSYSNFLANVNVSAFGQELFELLVSNQFPLYNKLIIRLLGKKVFEDNIFNVLLYTSYGKCGRIYLNSYCNEIIAHYLESEDLFNLYLCLTGRINTKPSICGPEKCHLENSEVAECDLSEATICSCIIPPNSEDSICCCIMPPKKKCRLC